MTTGGAPRTRAEWHAARTENLCTRGARFVTGSDIARTARALALEPRHVTQTAPEAADDPAGILTAGGRRRVDLRLANGSHGCVFLPRTSGGLGRCGLGDLAPVSCRAYPARLGDRTAPAPAADTEQTGATPSGGPRRWTEKDLGQKPLTEVRNDWTADRDHWFEVVKRWNALAAEYEGAKPADGEPGIRDFQHYLLEAYAAREAGTAWPGEATS
ncbi:hypothetical protein [Streptomyces sp. KMM 9044]|uniref:hypothetical protein n=1 Tax=Streptomyces sp. KMM 9044 TaxID=2744474 RepID=UPI002150730E|nr:hypothetical protein [Streptomyces sp. KMM 9044]WAX77843.1 hypothetical protein HUV60_009255 [Streptomyces sp. KMM 9044]